MPGFANARVLADAQDAGKYLYASFRKQATQTTGAGIWFDLSMSPGNPAPNYYIGTPGVFTPMRQSTDGGLRHGGNVSPSKKFLRKLLVQTATAAAAPCVLSRPKKSAPPSRPGWPSWTKTMPAINIICWKHSGPPGG